MLHENDPRCYSIFRSTQRLKIHAPQAKSHFLNLKRNLIAIFVLTILFDHFIVKSLKNGINLWYYYNF